MKSDIAAIVNQVAHEAFSGAWAIRPQSFDRFCIAIHAKRKTMDDEDGPQHEDKPECQMVGTVAVVPLYGVMMRNPGWLAAYGACDVDHFAAMVRMAADNPACTSILLDIDSPGGSVLGTQEAAQAVLNARMKKPCVAYTGGLMCSAAYWVGSQANAVYAAEMAIVGSIGVYAPVYDYSEAYKGMGIAVDVIKSGDDKAGNVAGAPVSKEYKANMQRIVDVTGATFRATVKAQRGNLKEEGMTGKIFIGSDSLGVGLIDSVTGFDRALADAGALALMRGA